METAQDNSPSLRSVSLNFPSRNHGGLTFSELRDSHMQNDKGDQLVCQVEQWMLALLEYMKADLIMKGVPIALF